MNRNVLIAIIAVVVIIALGLFIFGQPANTTTDGKINTQINFLSDASLKNGEQIQFELKDTSGKAIAGQNVSMAYTTSTGSVENYKVITDQNGKGYLTLKDEAAGKYEIAVTYDGNDQYNGCTGKMTFTIEDGTATQSTETNSNASASTVLYHNDTTATTTDSGSSQSSQQSQSTVHQTYYDPELNVYYDENGIVIGGQEPGASIYDLRNRPPMEPEGP